FLSGKRRQGGSMPTRRPSPRARTAIVVFDSQDHLAEGERFLKRHTRAAIGHMTAGVVEHKGPTETVRVRTARDLAKWLASARRPLPKTFLLIIKDAFDAQQRMLSALGSMQVPLPQLLSSGQDQIFVLDRDQRMVAFFGRWPEQSPRRPEALLGKRKRDVFG